MSSTRSVFYGVVFLISCSLLMGAEHSVTPYVDPTQLDCPFPKHSFYKQPWRGFLETRRGYDFVRGIGINYNVPSNDDLAVRLLAESGFKCFRIEIGWSSVDWDEQRLNNEARWHHVLELCKRYGIRPVLLLNANHGVPCPAKFFTSKLAVDAAKGSRTVRFVNTTGIVPGYSGINQLTQYWAAEALITAVDEKTGECTLSKPLPKDLKRDEAVPMATLKYLPLYPVGTPQYEETAAGWVRYAKLVTRLARDVGIDLFDVEIWNELSFGSNFTEAQHYFEPSPFKNVPDFLHKGGTCWELARRTAEAVKAGNPRIQCIWGFSNTTFYHCPIGELPPGIDGQSYHPYGTGPRRLPEQETHKDHPDFNLEGYTPKIEIKMPEGWAHEFIQTECIMRLLNPEARKIHPPGTDHFHHYMTEHGVAPVECGITDAAQSYHLKTLCMLRSFCLWLNKGVDQLDYFAAYEEKPEGFGILPTDFLKLSPDAKFDDVATEPMRALRNLLRTFDGAEPIETTTGMNIHVQELGEPLKIFDGDGTAAHPPLWQRDAVAVLPWQLTKAKFVIAAYLMTYDATKPVGERPYVITLGGLGGSHPAVNYLDPTSKTKLGFESTADNIGVIIRLNLSDMPRLILVELR